jgi:hypothetical protein
MKMRDFIFELAQSTKDNNMVVTPPEEWMQIFNAEATQLAPQVLFENTATLTWLTDTTINRTTYEVDMSSTTNYEGIQDIKKVQLLDNNGERYSYDNWIWEREQNILRLDPDTYQVPTIFPGDGYPTIKITWLSYVPSSNGEADINLDRSHISVLKKVCIKEALRRILVDHAKFDRYRTLVGRMNEFTLISIIRDYGTEIESDKRFLNNTNAVRIF